MNYKQYRALSLVHGSRWICSSGLDSRQMMIVLLLLGACAGVGLAYDQEEYGKTYRIRLHRKAESLEFIPQYNSEITILWKRYNPPARQDSRYEVTGTYFLINNVAHKDSGRYIMRDKDQKALSTKAFEVIASTRSYTRKPGENFNITFDLQPNSCNIYLISESGFETEIVRKGRLQWGLYESDCVGFELLKPCGVVNEGLQMSCSGRFEVRDLSGYTAFVVQLEMESPPFDLSHIGIGVGVFLGVLSCCCCVKRCCCGKSSSKKDRSETPDAEPAVHYHEYNIEPVGRRRDQVSEPFGTHYPAQPSYTPSGPLIHNTPTVNVPPAYSEVSAPSEPADAPTVRDHSDPGPRFKLSFPSALPLSSDSTCCDVYTSDKLNFL